jgi:hypothetical protein
VKKSIARAKQWLQWTQTKTREITKAVEEWKRNGEKIKKGQKSVSINFTLLMLPNSSLLRALFYWWRFMTCFKAKNINFHCQFMITEWAIGSVSERIKVGIFSSTTLPPKYYYFIFLMNENNNNSNLENCTMENVFCLTWKTTNSDKKVAEIADETEVGEQKVST